MNHIRPVLLYIFIGGASFWLPDILLHSFKYESPLVRTLILPLCLMTVYLVVKRFQHDDHSRPSAAVFMLMGVWLLASTAMAVSATFYGGGFIQGDFWIAILLGLVPPYTLVMATYDGSLGGLLLGSILLAMAHFIFEPANWIITPKTRSWLQARVQQK